MTIGESNSRLLPSHRALLQTNNSTFLLWSLIFLFALRVAGQAMQRWLPQTYLPPFNAFQGSSLPYWLLLSVQLVILATMSTCTYRIHLGMLQPSFNVGRTLAWTGGLYMTGSLIRIVVGLTMPGAPAWFSTWIPAVFHVVLAGFVLAMARHHLRSPSRPEDGGRQ